MTQGDPAARGVEALRRSDFAGARDLLQQAAAAGAPAASTLVNLALACRALTDSVGEGEALDRALALEPRLLPALLLKGAWLERGGQARRAGQVFGHALAVAPPYDHLPADLRGAVRHAHEAHGRYRAQYEDHLRDALQPALRDARGERLSRFEESVDIFLGKKAVYRQQPEGFFMPGLPTIQFFERDDFPWWPAVEAATGEVRAEFEAVLHAERGFAPYVNQPEGAPLDVWAGLNRSPQWSAYHLKEAGEPVAAHAAACPVTMEALAAVPQPTLPGRSPSAFFSLLKPGTRIPPHVGITNVRLVCHLPLIVPEGCRIRCGNEWRAWRVGEGLTFDDTIEHEAHNDSDRLRVVLIFDVWRPEITEAEKALLAVLMQGIDAFTGDAPGGAI